MISIVQGSSPVQERSPVSQGRFGQKSDTPTIVARLFLFLDRQTAYLQYSIWTIYSRPFFPGSTVVDQRDPLIAHVCRCGRRIDDLALASMFPPVGSVLFA